MSAALIGTAVPSTVPPSVTPTMLYPPHVVPTDPDTPQLDDVSLQIGTSGDRGLPSRPAAALEVVIPAFNEAARLPATLSATVEFLQRQPWSSRVLVVDNGSCDDTSGVVRRLADTMAGPVPVDVVGCARPGKGAAVRRGLLSSRSHYVGFFDADLATPVEMLSDVMAELRDGAAAVIGSRHAPGASVLSAQPYLRRLGGAAFRRLAGTMVPGVRDTQCGFKFFERRAITSALVRCRTTGFAFDVELLQCLQEDGGRIVELPVAWTDRPQSTFDPVRDGVASFAAVMHMQRRVRWAV